MSTKFFALFVSCLVVGTNSGCRERQPPSSPAAPAAATPAPVPAPVPIVLTPAERRVALEDLARRWEDPALGTGASRQAKLQSLCVEAVTRLGATNELAEFIDFLKTSGATAQHEWVLGPGLLQIFTGPSASVARENMLGVSDPAIRHAMCLRAGETSNALGFRKYLESLAVAGHADCQSSVLAGRCIALARNDLRGALHAFRELKTSNINFVCLGQVLAEVFKDADYAGVKATLNSLPEDFRRDAVQGLCGHQGKSVGAFLAAIDELILGAEWPKIERPICVKLHNLTIGSQAYDTLLAWAALLPERGDTEDLVRVAIRGCCVRQPAKAKQWIEALPPGSKQQNALVGYVQVSLMYRGDLPAARWALGRLTDPHFITVGDGFILEYEKQFKKAFPR